MDDDEELLARVAERTEHLSASVLRVVDNLQIREDKLAERIVSTEAKLLDITHENYKRIVLLQHELAAQRGAIMMLRSVGTFVLALITIALSAVALLK